MVRESFTTEVRNGKQEVKEVLAALGAKSISESPQKARQ